MGVREQVSEGDDGSYSENFWAHSRNFAGFRQPLREHLLAVAKLASNFAAPFASAGLGHFLGEVHDAGKFNREWQRYLLESEAGTRARGTGPDHKGLGTCIAFERLAPLAFIVAGHHGGLMNRTDLDDYVRSWNKKFDFQDLQRHLPGNLIESHVPNPPPTLTATETAAEMYLRMLFSALVDADYLDTEHHLASQRVKEARGSYPTIERLWQRFVAFHDTMPVRDDVVHRVRQEVYWACLAAAKDAPGLFRLTVPTGGGKTLSALGFALQHAREHDLARVIIAVPYTTITEQTAGVYREALGDDHAVLEHHSALDPTRLDDQTEQGLWARLACENWDAPVVVTTTVQLFESLFARATSKCRKLHRLARSVIILDEVQALPVHLLTPMLDVLQQLTDGYGASVTLCTATQPALDDSPGFQGLRNVREIVPDPPSLFAALRRVNYELPVGEEMWTWERAAEEMQQQPAALAITNTIADALALFDALDDPDALHLSTLLCGAHRRDTLTEICFRLKTDQPCRVVATQVVEAGVDIDFPVVLRATGPLDRVVQAAGRCNREGRLSRGRVVVFQPVDGHLPPGPYRTATALTKTMLGYPDVDLHDPDVYHRYFERLYDHVELDELQIQNLRRSFRYEDVAQAFRMIRDDTTSVYVRYDETAEILLERLRDQQSLSRDLIRSMQPYLVSIRTGKLKEYRSQGLVEEVLPDFCVWVGAYDRRRGLSTEHEVLWA